MPETMNRTMDKATDKAMDKVMNKTEYLRVLENRLKRLPGGDREKALEYFKEYFAEAGPEHEAQAIEDLGTPESAAEQLLTNLAIKNSEEPVKTFKRGMRGIKIGLLALFAVPIALPSAMIMVFLILMLLLVLLTLLAAFFLFGVIMIFGGISCIVTGTTALLQNTGQALGAIGLGFITAGFGLIVITGACRLTGFIQKKFIRLFGRIARRHSVKGTLPAQEGEKA